MASLLDFVVAQRNPRLAGLLGTGGPEEIPNQQPVSAPQGQALPSLMGKGQTNPAGVSPPGGAQPTVPQRSQGPSGIEGVLGQLFGGFHNPNLPPEANARARRQAMILGGLASFGSDKKGLGRLADAAMAGQQFGSQFRQQAAAAMAQADRERRQAQIGELIGGEDVTKGDVNKAIAMAESSGMTEASTRLREFKETLPGPEEEEYESVELADGTKAIFDATNGRYLSPTGEVMSELPGDPEEKVEDELKHVTLEDPVTGEPYTGVLNLTKGTVTRVPGARPITDEDEVPMDPDTLKLAAEATNARASIEVMKDYLLDENGNAVRDPPSFIDQKRFIQDGILVAAGARNISEEDQAFLQAQEEFLLTMANLKAGMRGVTQEQARAAITRAYGFQQGDAPANIEQTLLAHERRIRAMELGAGAALEFLEDVSLAGETPGEDEEDNRAPSGSGNMFLDRRGGSR